MKNVGKTLMLGCALLFSLMSFSGCATQAESDSPNEPAASAAAETRVDERLDGSSEKPAEVDAPQMAVFNYDSTIEETVLVDNDELLVEAKSLECLNNRAVLILNITNKTQDTLSVYANTLGFSANYINDFMVQQGYFSSEILPGETAEEELFFSTDELQLYGITGIEEIGLGIRATNDELDEVYCDIVNVKTSLFGTGQSSGTSFFDVIGDSSIQRLLSFNQRMQPAGSSDMGVVSVGDAALVTNMDDDTLLMFEIDNASGKAISVLIGNVSINGEACYDGLWTGETMAPDKRAIVSTLNLSSMVDRNDEFLDVSSIDEIGMEISVVDLNGNTLLSPTQLTFAP